MHPAVLLLDYRPMTIPIIQDLLASWQPRQTAQQTALSSASGKQLDVQLEFCWFSGQRQFLIRVCVPSFPNHRTGDVLVQRQVLREAGGGVGLP